MDFFQHILPSQAGGGELFFPEKNSGGQSDHISTEIPYN